METSDRLSMHMLETEPHFATIPRTLSPIQMFRSSVDRSPDYGSHSSDSGVGQDYTRRTASMEQIQSSTGIKLPVKHVTQSGTQRGTLLQRYLVRSHSKCIMCKDCGIFFSCAAFLCHSHDKHGRKRHRPQADILELDVENPGSQQRRAWEELLAKMGQKASAADSNLISLSFDSVNRPREQVRDSSNVQRPSTGRPEHLEIENINSGGASLSDFDRNVRESVNASERLLRETSQYLHSSAEKLKHRRQKSLRNHQLHPKALQSNDLTSDDAPFSGSSSDHIQPVIRDANTARPNSKRPNRKFLEKYLEKSRDSFQLLTDSMASKSTSKSDSVTVESSIREEYLQQQESSTLGGEDIGGDMVRGAVLGGGGGDVESEAVGHASSRPVSPGKTPRGKSILLQEHFDRNDPLFIVQTTQELLMLAALKMQDGPQKSPGGIDWQKRYETERGLNKSKDNRIKELEGLLHEEQRKRQEAEVQLRAIRLQNL